MKILLLFYAPAIVLAGLFFSCTQNKTASQTAFVLPTDSCGVVMLPVAYINVDTLLFNYEFAKDMNEIVLRKQEDARLRLSQRESALDREIRNAQNRLETEMRDFMAKVERQVFSTPERMQSEQARIAKQEQDLRARAQQFAQELQTLEQTLMQEVLAERQKINLQLKDSLDAALAIHNADKRYHMIFSNDAAGNSILYADKQYNITDDILTLLNSRYKK